MRRHRGVALISVLLIVVLISSLAFQLFTHQTMATTQTRLVLETTQLRELLIASEVYAAEALYQDWADEDSRTRDDLKEDWAIDEGLVENPLGNLRYQIRDQLAKVNINSLSRQDVEVPFRVFKNLLQQENLSAETAVIWRDWVDQDQNRYSGPYYVGKEDLDWLAHTPAFRTANQIATDLSELQIFTDLTRPEYLSLSQSVTVLPNAQLKVNLNTAPPLVLNALLPEGSKPMSGRMTDRNFGSVEAFLEIHESFATVRQFITVKSDYFEVQASITGLGTRMDMTSQLQRDPTTGQSRVYSRRFGVAHGWASQLNSA